MWRSKRFSALENQVKVTHQLLDIFFDKYNVLLERVALLEANAPYNILNLKNDTGEKNVGKRHKTKKDK